MEPILGDILFALSAVAPIVLMVLIGYFLKRLGWMNESFAKNANKLTFRAFMPVMLFLSIYGMDPGGQDLTYVWYVVLALLLIFGSSIPAVILLTKHNDRRGVLIQVAFRSGYSLIGIPLAAALNAVGGRQAAALLAAAVIPLYNVLAVVSFSLFSKKSSGVSIKQILLGIAKNPLIIGIAAGAVALGIRLLGAKHGMDIRIERIAPLYQVMEYMSAMAIPMALLVLGAQFEFSAVSSLKREIVFGTVVRTVIVPTVFVGLAYLLFRNRFTPAQFACIVSVFATPAAVTIGPMAQEMGGDVNLAGQAVVWTTIASALTVFLVTFLLRLGGAL
ncbi:MAG: AEC family transporter [Clostridia bacterium]|nr:AEC family transporter [Clostridia bacterium]